MKLALISRMPEHIHRSQLVSDAHTVIMEGMSRYAAPDAHTKLRREQIARGLETFSEATLRSIIGMRASSGYALHCDVIESAISGEDYSDEAFVSDYLSLSHCFTEAEGIDRLVQAVLAFESFEYYEGLMPQEADFSCPQRRVDQCTAIIALVKHLGEAYDEELIDTDPLVMEQFRGNRHGGFNYIVGECSNETLMILDDKNLRGLLTAPYADLAAITSVIIERNITNVDDIIGIVDTQAASPARAISSGVL